MHHTNAPRIVATAAGNVSIEAEIIDSQRRRRAITIVDVHVSILAGTVKAPNIIFKLALQEYYAAATAFAILPAHPNTDTIRMLIKHDQLTSHNHMWSSSTTIIGQGEGLHQILEDWENAMQSGEEVDLSQGAIEIIFQFVLTRNIAPNNNRVGAYKDRKEKMYNRICINDIFRKDKTLMDIPHTNEKVCFPMSFISAQCRY